MERPETKAYEGFAADVFNLAYLKYGSYVEVAGKIGTTGHYVSDVAKGEFQPTAPILMACLADVLPWLPEEMMKCVRDEARRRMAQRKAEAAALAPKETPPPNFVYLPASSEGASA